LLAGSAAFVVPAMHADLSSADVLAMDFVPGRAVEEMVGAPQEVRDSIMARLVALSLREMFEFHLMQTDPNFANYRYDEAGDRIVLLDFGATRALPEALSQAYRRLLAAGMAGEREAARLASVEIGLFGAETTPEQQRRVIDMFETAMAPMRASGPMAFDGVELGEGLREEGMKIAADRDFWHVPPADTLFIQRKLGGLFLLGARLKARVDVGAMMTRWI
jgi:predicted unusual protein kinase regulating ubiquinone biosynthesis (AarF/ABC1/UbiB family)